MRKKLPYILLMMFFLFGCQKEFAVDDIDNLLCSFKSKEWIIKGTAITKTYYWSSPRRFAQSDGITGLWYLPISGILRETRFSVDTTVTDYKILFIDKSTCVVKAVDDTTKNTIEYDRK